MSTMTLPWQPSLTAMFFEICIFCTKRFYFYFYLLSHYITLNLALFYQSECSAARGTRMKVEATED